MFFKTAALPTPCLKVNWLSTASLIQLWGLLFKEKCFKKNHIVPAQSLGTLKIAPGCPVSAFWLKPEHSIRVMAVTAKWMCNLYVLQGWDPKGIWSVFWLSWHTLGKLSVFWVRVSVFSQGNKSNQQSEISWGKYSKLFLHLRTQSTLF